MSRHLGRKDGDFAAWSLLDRPRQSRAERNRRRREKHHASPASHPECREHVGYRGLVVNVRHWHSSEPCPNSIRGQMLEAREEGVEPVNEGGLTRSERVAWMLFLRGW